MQPLVLQYRRQVQPSEQTLRTALQWAVCTIHSQVLISEREFARYYYWGILPRTLPKLRHRALADIQNLPLNYSQFRRLSIERKLNYLVSSIHGLGYAKAAFALACSREADIGCLDSHMAQRHGLVSPTGRVRSTWYSARQYLSDCSKAWGDWRYSGRKQWREYAAMDNSAGRRTRQYAHEAYFQAVGVRTIGQKELPLWV